MSSVVRKTVNSSLVAGAPGADLLERWGFSDMNAAPVEREVGYDATGHRVLVRTNTANESVAWLSDIAGIWQSRGAISTAVLPTAATATVRPGVALADYNTFLVTAAAPITIAGIGGADTLDAGDLLVLVDSANPTVPASWVGIQQNVRDGLTAAREVQTGLNLAVDTALTVTAAILANIDGAWVYDSTGIDITSSIVVTRASPTTMTLQSSVALAGVEIRMYGTI